MRYECHNCGRRFEEPDIITETHGLDIGPYEKIGVCPYCKGYFAEIHECKICGEHYTDDELTSGVCDECIYEDVTFDRCLRYGADREENIAINGFIASVLDAETINRILTEEIRKASQIIPINLDEFVEEDKSWFAEQLIKEKQNAEKF